MIDFENEYMPDVDVKDSVESMDLTLYAITTGDFYQHWMVPTAENLATKIFRGNYNPKLGLKAFKHLADEAARWYNEELKRGSTMEGFSEADRKACAVDMMEYCRELIQRSVRKKEKGKVQSPQRQKSR